MLAVALVDAFVDRLFERSDLSDVLEFRRRIGEAHPVLGLVMSIASHRADGPKLAIANRPVPIERYGELAVEDFMVSLYNDHSVQQLVVQSPGASDMPALALVQSALRDLRTLWDGVAWQAGG